VCDAICKNENPTRRLINGLLSVVYLGPTRGCWPLCVVYLGPTRGRWPLCVVYLGPTRGRWPLRVVYLGLYLGPKRGGRLAHLAWYMWVCILVRNAAADWLISRGTCGSVSWSETRRPTGSSRVVHVPARRPKGSLARWFLKLEDDVERINRQRRVRRYRKRVVSRCCRCATTRLIRIIVSLGSAAVPVTVYGRQTPCTTN
jgi:hypothetical protein